MALGLALVPLMVAMPTMLTSGGLAPVVVAATIGVLLSSRAAAVLWRSEREFDPGQVVVSRTLLLVSAAAGVAQLAQAFPPLGGVVLALAPWVVVGILRSQQAPLARVGVAAVLLAAMPLLAAIAIHQDPGAQVYGAPWSGLTPDWGSWRDWLPAAARTGALLGLVGPGFWAIHHTRRPGGRGLPWLSVGVAILITLVTCLLQGLRQETLPMPEVDWLGVAMMPLAILGCFAATATSAPRDASGLADVGLGLALTAWLLGPGASALPWWWCTVLPLAIGIELLWVARRHAESERWVLIGNAILLIGAAVASFPGVPGSLQQAMLASATLVAISWIAGARLARAVPT